MYVGIDVYHDGAKGKGRSVAGLVASLNKAGTRYYSRVTTQGPGEELISGLKTCLIAALKKYHSVCLTSSPPHHYWSGYSCYNRSSLR